ncbi:hypothetical protein L7F22_016063 [Adiantum nelumboides]|nr:hypothetical protein [Adiantum nelumboides]
MKRCEKVELDDPRSYDKAMALAKGRTKKILKKQQARQGLPDEVMSKQIEVVRVEPKVVQKASRVLWLQRDGVVPMLRMLERAAPIVQNMNLVIDQAREVHSSQDKAKAMKLENILELEPEVKDVLSNCSSIDADTSWTT